MHCKGLIAKGCMLHGRVNLRGPFKFLHHSANLFEHDVPNRLNLFLTNVINQAYRSPKHYMIGMSIICKRGKITKLKEGKI